MQEQIVIIGAGGHGKVVLSTLLAAGKKVTGFLDDNPKLMGKKILGYEIIGDTTYLNQHPDQIVIFGLGNNKLRMTISMAYPHLKWQTVVHPHAYVHESVSLGAGTVIFAGAIIQPDTCIGKHAIINTSSSVDHDSEIGDYVHIAPGSHLAGGTKVGKGSFIGIGSAVIPEISIGEWSMIAAGSVVVDSIDNYTHVKGVPAKTYKKIIA